MTALLVPITLIAAGCSWFGSDPTKLKIAVLGLPEGVSAAVTVEGPDGATYELTEDDEREVEPGDYMITVAPVGDSNSTYYTDFDFEEVTLEAEQTATFEVDYRIEIPASTKIVETSAEAAPIVDGSDLTLLAETAPEGLDTSEYVIATGANTASGVVVKRVEEITWGEDSVVITGEDVPLFEAMPKGVIDLGNDVLEPKSHIIPGSYGPSEPEIGQEQETGGNPLFEVAFGGYQAGITSSAVDKNYSDVKNVKGCSFEIPPTKFGLNDFAIIPDGDIAWDTAKEGPSANISLIIQGAYTVTTEGTTDVKCSLEANLEDIHADKLCAFLGYSKIVRVGPINLECGVTAAVKGNIHLPKSEGKTETSSSFNYAARASLNPDGEVDGETVSESHEDVTAVGPAGVKYAIEMATQVSIGGELAWLIGAAVVVEQSIAVEEDQEEIKVPFKGKIFLRYEIGADAAKITQEVQLFHWSTDLYHLEKNPDAEPSPSDETSVADDVPYISVGIDEYRDQAIVSEVAEQFKANEGNDVDIDIQGEEGDNLSEDDAFDVWAYDPDDPMHSSDNALILNKQCWDSSLNCFPLILHFPTDYDITMDESHANPGVSYILTGRFSVDEVWVNDDFEMMGDHLPSTPGIHVNLSPTR